MILRSYEARVARARSKRIVSSHRPGVATQLKKLWAPLVGAMVIIGLWYAIIGIFDIDAFLLPTPHAVLDVFIETRSLLFEHGVTTMLESVVGLGLSVVVGALLAVLISEIPFFSRAILPWLVVSQAVPKVAVAPLFLIWFGFGLMPKIIVAFFISFFPIVIGGASGLSSVLPEEADLFRTTTRSKWKLYRHLKIPRALPQFFDGVKVGTTLALVGAIVGEFVSSQEGLGYLVTISNRDLKTEQMFAVFVALSIVGILLFYAVVLLERLVIPWHFIQRKGARAQDK